MRGFLRLFIAFQLSLLGSLADTSPKFEVRQSTQDESGKYVLPVGSPDFYNGQSKAAVTFDQHSLLLDGKRLMFFSGEFHPFRLPAPELWRDVLEKSPATPAFSLKLDVGHWGLSAPNSKEVRLTEHNDVAKFYQVAKEVGILVIVRPGPYVNAETAGGGIPGWATNLAGLARTNATDYRTAWYPYILEFAKQTAPFQYPDGPVIAIQSENEYATTGQAHIPGLNEHMQDIINTYREGGLTKIPTIHNDKNPSGQYALPGPGKVDLYGWDGYPLGFDCDQPTKWGELSTRRFFSEVYYKNNYASGASLQNLYMTYGGTNWGNMHTHTIYSSYDYGAAIREDRTLSPKLDELKLQAYFLHASRDYLVVGRIGNGTVGQGTAYSNSADIYTTHLNSPSTEANFYVVRQVTNTKITDTDFTLRINTTLEGQLTIPKSGNLTLAGRESKIIVSNYPFGSSRLQYSTAEIMTWATFDKVDTLVVYALAGQSVEIAVENPTASNVTVLGSRSITAAASGKVVTISGSPSDVSVVTVGNKRIIVADKKTASAFWAPRLAVSGTRHALYDLGPEVPSVLVKGPYLVRSAAVQGATLRLTGDLNSTTTIDVFAPAAVKAVFWNGVSVKVARSDIGSLRGTVPFPGDLDMLQIPVLSNLEWKCADSLPELSLQFDDSKWVLANKTSTSRPQKPTGGKNVLYSSEQVSTMIEIKGNCILTSSLSDTDSMQANGCGVDTSRAMPQAYSSLFKGTHRSLLNLRCHIHKATSRPTADFPSDILLSSTHTSWAQDKAALTVKAVSIFSRLCSTSRRTNFYQAITVSLPAVYEPTLVNTLLSVVITVIHDSTGMNQDYNINDEHKTPRGIRGYKLLSADGKDFTQWRVAGNIGGEDAPDKVRGPYNEGGWWFERAGAHLPGYDASSWQTCSPYQGITKPGVTVYRTKFDLNLPRGSDVPLAFDFALDSVNPHRVLIYVNGWQFGRFLSSLGPQTSFPIPEGILNHHGTNEVLISLWALGPQGAKLTKLELNRRATISSSKAATVNIVPAPGWKELRGNVVTN
ncbi:putative glycoside hydrolase family 35 protein [Lyophyllum shimeji]|uniref:beta-galactosidase n=1 Tax=Lyophyllum shimeji TaxID=47721 RepID=A0A9P3PUH9_LYOSH|nr:putative glycoside hydrolase family 35 protein [Lyophyllum shimeji]